MKKLIAIGILSTVLLAVAVSKPVLEEPEIVQTVVKIDDQTCEITTVMTSTDIVRRDKAELQTELDHIPDRLAELQRQIDEVNERKAELIEILKVFN